MQLPSELEEIVYDFVRDRIRPGLKARLWRDLHRELRLTQRAHAGAIPVCRSQETGEIVFDFEDRFTGSRTIVPITALMDLNNQVFYYQAVADEVNVWIQIARDYPTKRRNCFCCNRRAVLASVLCSTCIPTYHATVYAE